MAWDVAGLGNALMDALVVVDDDQILTDLGLIRGTMHPVDHDQWHEVYERVKHHGVVFDSGGSCANTVATVGRLGGRAIYCGHVGDDQMGRLYARRIEEACGGHALRFSASMRTGKCLSIISRTDAERTMLTDLGAATRLPDLGAFEADLTRARVAHFTGYTLLPGEMQAVALDAMGRAHAAGVEVSFDAADPFVVAEIRDLVWRALEETASIAFLNSDEARQLTGEDPEHAIVTIADRAGLDTVVVKLGAHGSLVRRDGETVHVGVYPVRAVDTTGAGDAYAGGFLFAHTRGWDPRHCGQLASAVAAHTVAQVGAVVRDADLLRQVLRESVDIQATA